MKTLPKNRLIAPFKQSGVYMLQGSSSKKSLAEQKTFFKGASSFALQVESSMRIKNND
jgi:hypothetical protein